MTFYDFDQVPDRRSSDSVKWHAYAEDVLPLWVADMDFVSPEPMIRALHQRIEHGIFGYPTGLMNSPKEISDFRQTLIDHLYNLYKWQIEPEDIILMPGVVTGVNLACHTLAEPGAAVIIQTPVYPPILHAAETTGLIHQEMELTLNSDGSYSVDRDAFENSLTPETRLFILCNPHNPVGRVFRPDELTHMAQACLQQGVTIVSDEIHCDLIYNGYPHTPVAALDAEIARQTITLIAPSKTYNIAGLQCSFAIIQNRDLRHRYLKARKGLVPWVNLMGVVAARAAYEEGQEWLDQLLAYLEANRAFLYEYVNTELPGIKMWKPEGTYLAWLDCRNAGIPGNPYQFFLDKGRVAFNDGVTFGQGGEGFIRLNFGCPRSTLAEALERMKRALEGL
ncbi:MAG: MalY/PatB family protein [Chloroflexota bacterium]